MQKSSKWWTKSEKDEQRDKVVLVLEIKEKVKENKIEKEKIKK